MIVAPCYVDYRRACERAGLAVTACVTTPERDFALDVAGLEAALPGEPAVVFVGRPQNPTGQCVPDGPLRELAARRPDCLFVIDEAFADFVPDFSSLTRDRPHNAAILLSLTKAFAVPGLRLGLAAAEAAFIDRVRAELAPWPVNTLAQAAGQAFLGDAAYLSRTREAVGLLRHSLAGGLAALPGVRVFPSQSGRAPFSTACRGIIPGWRNAPRTTTPGCSPPRRPSSTRNARARPDPGPPRPS